MITRKKRSNIENGHDAFLDIVANLVGILIILVVILGAKSQEVIRQTEQEIESSIQYAGEAEYDALATTAARAAAAQADSVRLEKTIKAIDQQIAAQNRMRGNLLDLLAEAELAWQDHQKKLDEKSRVSAELLTNIRSLQQSLAQINAERDRLKNQETPVVAISHLPTPMAKTVFGTEIHMRLKNNRLSVVPVERLLSEMKRDLSRVANGARDGIMDAAIGPVNGYVARYAVNKSDELVSRGGAVGRMTKLQLQAIIFEPLEEPFGIPVDQVLKDRQWLDIQLAGRDPGSTTLTVWVYPNSYASFRALKEQLYVRGFATAGRPLDADRPIMASPHGTRSAAQ